MNQPTLSGEENIRLLDELEVPANFYTLYIILRRKSVRFNYLYHLLSHARLRVSKLELKWHLARLEKNQIIREINVLDNFYLLNPTYVATLTDLYRGIADDKIHQLAYVLEKTNPV